MQGKAGLMFAKRGVTNFEAGTFFVEPLTFCKVWDS